MMQRTTRRWCLGILLAALPLWTTDAQTITDFDRAAAQVIFDNIYMESNAGRVDDGTIRNYMRHTNDAADKASTRSLGHRHSYRGPAGTTSEWALKIRLLSPEWLPDREVATRWAVRYQGTVDGMRVYYEAALDDQGQLESSKTWIKHRRGDLQLLLEDVQRPHPEWNADTHIESAIKRMRFTIAASRNIPIDGQPAREDDPLRINLEGPDFADLAAGGRGAAIDYANPDVISIDEDTLDARRRISLRGWLLRGDEAYTEDTVIRARLTGDPGALRLIGPGADSSGTAGTYLISPESPVFEVTARFEADASTLGQFATLTLWVDGKKDETLFRLVLHRTTWVPTLRTFELQEIGTARGGVRHDADTGREVGFGHAYNQQRVRAASAWRAWQELEALIATRPRDRPGDAFTIDEPVPMGHRFNSTTGASFHEAWNEPRHSDPTKRGVASWVAGSNQRLWAHVWIEREPTPGVDGVNSSVYPDELEQQQWARHKSLIVRDFKVTLTRVAANGVGFHQDPREIPEPTLMELARAIRQPAGSLRVGSIRGADSAPPGARSLLLREASDVRLSEIDWLHNTKKSTGAGGEPVGSPGEFKFRIIQPGIYEVRFLMELASASAGPEAVSKTIDVAFRVNVVSTRFDATPLLRDSGRAR